MSTRRIHHGDGAAIAEFDAQKVLELGKDELILAFLALTPEGVSFLWLPALFLAPGALTPDFRKEIVAKLRMHADTLESGEADRRMKEMNPDADKQS